MVPLRSSHGCSGGPIGVSLPKSTTPVTPLLNASSLALRYAALLSSTDGWGIRFCTYVNAESTNSPVGSTHNKAEIDGPVH